VSSVMTIRLDLLALAQRARCALATVRLAISYAMQVGSFDGRSLVTITTHRMERRLHEVGAVRPDSLCRDVELTHGDEQQHPPLLPRFRPELSEPVAADVPVPTTWTKEPLVFCVARSDDEAKNLTVLEHAGSALSWPVVVASGAVGSDPGDDPTQDLASSHHRGLTPNLTYATAAPRLVEVS
jgi:hypothetical protein